MQEDKLKGLALMEKYNLPKVSLCLVRVELAPLHATLKVSSKSFKTDPYDCVRCEQI